ncbi:MAG: DUF177 domain-containing protein [Proteobacteria bacterium]|nr:DUF177 domain-containing protein [Pseudomonadota bacterium]
MLHKELPIHLAPEKLCRHAPPEGTPLVGEIKLSDLTNLSKELKAKPDTVVTVNLLFSMDADGLCAITGELSADLEVICQRCLAPMIYPLRAEISVSPVVSDSQAENLPTRYEPLWVPTGEINVAEWIAEEIHLALPLAPSHEPPCVSFDSEEESS